MLAPCGGTQIPVCVTVYAKLSQSYSSIAESNCRLVRIAGSFSERSNVTVTLITIPGNENHNASHAGVAPQQSVVEKGLQKNLVRGRRQKRHFALSVGRQACLKRFQYISSVSNMSRRYMR